MLRKENKLQMVKENDAVNYLCAVQRCFVGVVFNFYFLDNCWSYSGVFEIFLISYAAKKLGAWQRHTVFVYTFSSTFITEPLYWLLGAPSTGYMYSFPSGKMGSVSTNMRMKYGEVMVSLQLWEERNIYRMVQYLQNVVLLKTYIALHCW